MRKVEITGVANGKNYTTTEFRPDVKQTIKPIILKEYYDADNIRTYKTIDNRIFNADRFDYIFGASKKGEIKPEHFKGKNPDKTRDWMK